MDLFEEFKNLYSKELKIDSSVPVKTGYMLNRFISFSSQSFWEATEANRLMRGLPAWAVGCLLFNLIERQRPPYVRYPKAGKQESNDVIIALMGHFNCSEFYAEQIKSICKKEGIDLYSKFGIRRPNVSSRGSGRRKEKSRR